MKHYLVIFLFAFSLQIGVSQTMTWLPSNKVNTGCKDMSNAKKNILCYKLQYVPEQTGVLTSYTTGFWADCLNGNSNIVLNQSCSMIDNSQQMPACEKFGKTLLNCSGNSGAKASNFVKKGVPIYLHQICFQIDSKQEVNVMEDDLLDLTTSIDVEGETAKTFFPTYKTLSFKNDQWVDFVKTDEIALTLQKKFSKSSLKWTPANETGNGFYLIERSSDNRIFNPIFRVEDGPDHKVDAHYLFTDTDKMIGEAYYRITYQSLSDLNTVSNVVNVIYESDVTVELYPNPAIDYINLRVDSKDEIVTYKIFDSNGLLRANSKVKSNELHKLDVSSFGSGVYNITIETKENFVSRKFIVIAL